MGGVADSTFDADGGDWAVLNVVEEQVKELLGVRGLLVHHRLACGTAAATAGGHL